MENSVPQTTNIEEISLSQLKSSFNVAEFATGASVDSPGGANKPLAARLGDSKPVVRRAAYAELATLFAAEDTLGVDYEEHAPALKKMLMDNASNCHEPALDVITAFAQKAPPEIVVPAASAAAGALVEKHAAGKYQPKAIEALLSLVGVGKEGAAAVQHALTAGAKHKVPKTCAAAAKALVATMRGFPSGTLDAKALTPLLVPLIEHRDKSVRDEGMALLGEVRIARGDLVFKELKGLSEEKINELKGMGLPEPPQPTERRGARQARDR